MVQKAKKGYKTSKGIGMILGSIPLFIIALISFDIYIENFSRNEIATLQAEILEYPEFATEIMEEISIVTRIGIVLVVIGLFSIIMGVFILTKGIQRRE